MMTKLCGVHKAAYVLVLVGALNWGLVGLFKWDLVASALGSWPMLVRVVQIFVGLAAVMMLLAPSCKPCKECDTAK